MKRKILVLVILCGLLLGGALVTAKEYKVEVVQLGSTDLYINLAKAVADETKNTFTIEVAPRARAFYLIENNQVDIMLPFTDIQSPKKQNDLKFDNSIILFKICYVLYTNKNKNITADELKNSNPKNYKIETDTANAGLFEFNAASSSSVEASLTKVDNGSIDGFIFAQPTGDVALKKLGLKNIKRQPYSYYNTNFAIQKGAKGSELDKIINDGIAKLKANGKFDAILGSLIKAGSAYIEWQT